MNPILIALFAFLGGCLFIGLVVFLVMLYKEFGKMRDTFEITSMHMDTLAERIPEMLVQWNELVGKLMTSNEMCAVKMISSQELATIAARDQAAVSNKASAVFAAVGEQVKLLIKSFDTFSSMVWKAPDAEQEAGAPNPTRVRRNEGEGTFIAYDEGKMASEEIFTEARRHGVELQESALFTPDKSRMVGGDVDPKHSEPDSHGPVPQAQNSTDAGGGDSKAG